MLSLPLFSWNVSTWNCVCPSGKAKNDDDHDVLSQRYQDAGFFVHVLPTKGSAFKIDNLFPAWNHVESWNTFVIGNDKTYILANVNSMSLREGSVARDQTSDADKETAKSMLNNSGRGVLPNSLVRFLDPLWDCTLAGRPVQVFIVVRNNTYIVNTYPLTDPQNHVVGGVMFLRFFAPYAQAKSTSPAEAIASLIDDVRSSSFEQERHHQNSSDRNLESQPAGAIAGATSGGGTASSKASISEKGGGTGAGIVATAAGAGE